MINNIIFNYFKDLIMANAKMLFKYFSIFLPVIILSQICEPVYIVPKLIQTNSLAGEMTDGSNFTANITIGQAIAVNKIDNVTVNSSAMGFWSNFLTEPVSPVLRASDGDFQEMVMVEWDIQDDLTGPPVTAEHVTLVRNDFILATLPLSQTQYLDFNVFPGSDYEYEAIVSNGLGSSRGGENWGFLNPNGIITGQVLSGSGNPVKDTKVTLSPNLGKSIQFQGDGYIYWFDEDINTNRQFAGLDSNYTIETWFRSVTLEEQTMYSAVDSASANSYINIGLTSGGRVSWTHRDVTIESVEQFAGPGQPWHHLAVVFNNGVMTMYTNGAISGESTGVDPLNDKVEMVLGKNGPADHTKYFSGYLDDFRIWNYPVEWEEILNKNDLTLRGNEDHLVAYWKLDEVEGDNVFDLSDNQFHGSVCNIVRSEVFAPVYVGDLTDTLGNYAINGIYYGQGTTFTVSPSKATIIGRSLDFDGIDDYVAFQLQRINLIAGFTIEGWFKTESSNEMTLFFAEDPASAEGDEDAQVRFRLVNGIPTISYFDASLVGNDPLNNNQWHHWAATLDDDEGATLSLYIDGEQVAQEAASTSSAITLISRPGFASNGYDGQFFEGTLDEFRIWSGPRNIDQISGTMNTPLTGEENGLINYWNFNDGMGALIHDNSGSLATGTVSGMVEGEEAWTIDIPLDETFDHYYEPESRQSTLNYSNTSVDLVNFTDKSLIPVSGYVRYENTSCFIENAEVLVDGESLIPPIFTDADGKYIVDIEPGSVGKLLSVSFNDHDFIPPVIELPLITVPITGLYFDDTKTYDVTGIVVGGSCKFPITSDQGDIKVTFSSVSGCIEKTVVPDTLTGAFTCSDLPPIIYNVSVYHPNPDILFTADTLSLEDGDRSREFVYQAPLETEFIGLPETEVVCETYPLVLNQREKYFADFEVYETYVNQIGPDASTYVANRCIINNFNVEVFDNISGTTYEADLEVEGDDPPFVQFTGKEVNLLSGGDHPYQKSIQIVVEDALSRTATTTMWAFIQGDKKIPGVNFSTTTSKMPWYVLRVPPGDGSATYMSTDQTLCNTTSRSSANADGSATNVVVHAGVDLEIEVGVSFGAHFATTLAINATLDIGAGFSTTTTYTSSMEECKCLTTSETYATSGDGLTGDAATVFIGGGTTVDIGIANYIRLEECGVKIDTVMTSDQTGVNSTYLHSKYYVESFLMPSLLDLYNLNDDQDALDNYNYWQTILEMDSAAVVGAVTNDLVQIGEDGEEASSISFDAGADLEYSYTRENSSSFSFTETYENLTEEYLNAGVSVNGIGITTDNVWSTTSTNENTQTNDITKSQTIGFILSDDDAGDGFSFNAKRDLYWDMPVFELIGGQSSCPWEAGTFRRQLPALSATENSVFDVLPGEPANFTLLLGNSSETGEDQSYILSVLGESNPDGAVVEASGTNLAGGVSYTISAGAQIEVTVSIYRGPIEYDYENIILMLASACDGQNSAIVSLTAKFQKPCSNSNIFLPETGWVVTSSHDDGDSLFVTLNEFDAENEALESLDLQYRTAGLGDWFTALSIVRDTLLNLTDDFIIVPWNIKSTIVPDGQYDLRSVAICSGDAPDGVSNVITGFIDRNAPSVFGLPEPVDGILGANDLIRVTFDEYIDCESINQGAGDLALFNTVTGTPLDFNYTCGENMITIEANVSNQYIENLTFRAEINQISDLLDNSIDEPIMWEFFVNRNPIEWIGSNISDIVLYVEEEFSTQKQLINNGGSNRSWYMHGGRDISPTAPEYPGNSLDLPSWLVYSPYEGTLTPGSSQDVSISLAEGLNFGEYSTVLYAGVNGQGDEPMIVDIRKICHEPEWALDPSGFQFSMNITGMLRTMPSPATIDTSSDTYDMIGVFVGEELRGVGTVEYLPDLESISNFHPYEVFLTIYSNLSEGEDLSFRVWDASNCAMMGQIEESIAFNANEVLGSLTNPVNLTATNEILTVNNLPTGWNWLSVNTFQTDMSINTLLASLDPSSDDIIKSQTEFAQYSTVSNMWVGDLDSIDYKSTYLLKIAGQDTLNTVGFPVDVELDTIQINEGWNWVGYTPQESYEINEALASLDTMVITGNIVKSQTSYAQYLESYGWFGSMSYMDPGKGYFLKSENDGVLLYPFNIPRNNAGEVEGPETLEIADNAPDWTVDPSLFYGSMNITGELVTLDELSTNPLDMIAAFVDGDCRGVGQPVYIEPLGKYLVFLTVYGNESETSDLQFYAYSESNDEILFAPENLPFELNEIIGDLEEPYLWDTRFLEAGDKGFVPDVFSLSQNYPNPFNPVTTIAFSIPEISNVNITIYDILGKKVSEFVNEKMDPGFYLKTWDSRNDLGMPVAAGIYFYQLRAENFIQTRKLVLLK
jgi:hypothetical protein